jgi:uncharacterized membrane protein
VRHLVPPALFVILLVAAAVWVGALADRLPELVAVHFDAAGVANGFMAHAGCRDFMLLFTIGAPCLIALVSALLPRLLPARMLNIPHREYWMAPGRAEESIAFLSAQGFWFSSIFLVFLTGADWMVARANAVAPPLFPSRGFLWMLVLFFVAVGVWAHRMFRRFSRPM